MAKVIFFDIDDTLFPSTEFAELARRNALKAMISMGVNKSEASLYKMLMKIIRETGSNYTGHFDELCKKLKLKRPARFIAAAVAAYHNTKTSIQPYPAVPKMLLSLRESGYRLYIASNGKAKKQWDKLIRLRIALYFVDVFVSAEVGMEKSPSFFRKVLRTLNTKPQDQPNDDSFGGPWNLVPSDAVMVGDREDADILPAKKVGLTTVRVKTGKHRGRTSADFEIDQVTDLLKILESLKTSHHKIPSRLNR